MIHGRCTSRVTLLLRFHNKSCKSPSLLVPLLIPSQVEKAMPPLELAAAHMTAVAEDASNAPRKRLTPSDKIRSILVRVVESDAEEANQPKLLVVDETVHAKLIVKESQIPVTSAIIHRILLCDNQLRKRVAL